MGPVHEVGTAALVGVLGDWAAGTGPLHALLSRALLRAVRRGDLPPGTRLPAERALAVALSVSRGTVVTAYASLRDDGWLASRQGSGTWVRVDAPRPLALVGEPHPAAVRARTLSARLVDRPAPDVVDLAISSLWDLDAVPEQVLQGLTREALLADGDQHGYQPLGSPALRAGVAARYTAAGLPTAPEEVLITTGAQQALALTAAATVRPGDAVVLESPTYPGAIDTFARAGARLVPVPAEPTWASTAVLEEAVVRSGARLAYLMPACHNPLGTVMPDGRRRALAALFDRLDTYLFCDDILELVTDRPQPLPVAAHAAQGRVITSGSLSKVAWGGFRVGWLRGPADLIARVGRARAASDYGMSVVTQAVAADLLPHLDDVAAHRRASLRARRELVLALLREQLPSWSTDGAEGGLSLWVRLPVGTADAFAQHALRAGVTVTTGSVHCVDDAASPYLRLSYGQAPEVLAEGVRRLAVAWEAHLAAVDRRLRRLPGEDAG